MKILKISLIVLAVILLLGAVATLFQLEGHWHHSAR